MILLDTDHLTVLKYTDNERYAQLHGRLLAAAAELVGTTIVNVEEQMRGWLAAIAKGGGSDAGGLLDALEGGVSTSEGRTNCVSLVRHGKGRMASTSGPPAEAIAANA